jgi:acyl carrier protein
MNKQEFLKELEDILEIDSGTLTEDEMLYNIVSWDSLSVMAFIGFVDESLELTLDAIKVNEAESISNLIALIADKLEN